MPIIATNKSNFVPVPEGTWIARCVGVIDLGTQATTYKSASHMVMLVFEFPEHTFEQDGKVVPMTISRKYTLSTHPKSELGKAIEAWRGKALTKEEAESFDVARLLGVPCFAEIKHREVNNATYANVAGITKLHASVTCPPAVNELILYEIGMGIGGTYGKLSEHTREILDKAEEFKPAAAPTLMQNPGAAAPLPDDPPF